MGICTFYILSLCMVFKANFCQKKKFFTHFLVVLCGFVGSWLPDQSTCTVVEAQSPNNWTTRSQELFFNRILVALFFCSTAKLAKTLNASPSTNDSLHLEVYPMTFKLLGLQRRYRICLAIIYHLSITIPSFAKYVSLRVGKTVEIS